MQSLGIVPGWETDQGTRMTGLELRLEPGWKTYWRAPGEAGIPPRFDWTGSDNLRDVRVHWPRPEVFDTNGMRTIGYHDEVTFPLELIPEDPAKPIKLRARADFGVCSDICIPVSMDFETAVDRGNGEKYGQRKIRAALNDRPSPARQAGVASVHCRAEPIRDGLRLTTEIALPAQGRNEVAIVEHGNRTIWVSEAESIRDDGLLRVVAELVPPEAQPFALDRSEIRITVLGQNGAVDIHGCTGG
ncbi:MAG: protein-disulfide reductase DsbD domain-containing protein [Pseudomonadota bacterium]